MKKKKKQDKSREKVFFTVGHKTLIKGEYLQKIFGIKVIGKENSFCDLDYYLDLVVRLKDGKEGKMERLDEKMERWKD